MAKTNETTQANKLRTGCSTLQKVNSSPREDKTRAMIDSCLHLETNSTPPEDKLGQSLSFHLEIIYSDTKAIWSSDRKKEFGTARLQLKAHPDQREIWQEKQ